MLFPIWQIDGETMETVTDFIFVGSKITTDGDCSLEIQRRLLLPFSPHPCQLLVFMNDYC